MITLSSAEGTQVQVEREVAEKSVMIKNMLEDLGDSESAIPLMHVSGPVLHKVIEWCQHHKNDDTTTSARFSNFEISPWDEEFFKVDQGAVFELILAANYLDIKLLLDIGCKTVANMIKGKSPEELRTTFNIKNDLTPEEEEAVRRENA